MLTRAGNIFKYRSNLKWTAIFRISMTPAERLARESSPDDLAQERANIEWAIRRSARMLKHNLAVLRAQANQENWLKIAYLRLVRWAYEKLS